MEVTEKELAQWAKDKNDGIHKFYLNISEGYGDHGMPTEEADAKFEFKIFKLAQLMHMDIIIPEEMLVGTKLESKELIFEEKGKRISLPLASSGGVLVPHDYAKENIYCHPAQLSGVMKAKRFLSLRDSAMAVGLHITTFDVCREALATTAERLIQMFCDPLESKRIDDAIVKEMLCGGEVSFNAMEDIHKPTVEEYVGGFYTNSSEHLAVKAIMARRGLPTGWVNAEKKGGK